MAPTTRDESIESLRRSLTLVARRTAVPRAHERLVQRAGVEIDRVEAIALSRIADQGSMWLTELARQLGVACSTAGRHASHLEDRGLCRRSVDPEDGRAVAVAATEKGRRLVARLRAAYREVLTEALGTWHESELEDLAKALSRLAEDLAVLSEIQGPIPA